MDRVLYEGESIKQLIPQRDPIMMVDALCECREDGCDTRLTVRPGNIFCRSDAMMANGLIEHMAQSASAFMGYHSLQSGEEARIGYIGEVRDFTLFDFPKVGESIETCVKVVSSVMNVTLIEAESKSGGRTLATCRMKIAV